MPCHKLAFRDVESALRTASVVASFRPGSKQPLRIYECPDCRSLHFTSLPEFDGATTVAVIDDIRPLFVAQRTDTAHAAPVPPVVPLNPCAACGREMENEGYALGDLRFHKRCRVEARKQLPPAERRRLDRFHAITVEIGSDAKLREMVLATAMEAGWLTVAASPEPRKVRE
jgi:hypothetical protein